MAQPDLNAAAAPTKLNVDFLAIAIALTLAVLIRLDILPQIKW